MEEEPEGEDLEEDSAGHKYVLPFFFKSVTKHFYINVCFHCLTIFLSEKSEEEEEVRPLTKEEEEVEVMHSWVEAGGFPAHPEGEAKELLAGVSVFPCSSSFLPLYT